MKERQGNLFNFEEIDTPRSKVLELVSPGLLFYSDFVRTSSFSRWLVVAVAVAAIAFATGFYT
jgi:hypothetical protein